MNIFLLYNTNTISISRNFIDFKFRYYKNKAPLFYSKIFLTGGNVGILKREDDKVISYYQNIPTLISSKLFKPNYNIKYVEYV